MLQDLVRDVPRDIAHRTGTRVAPYHGRARDFKRGERSGIRCMREIDKDSETVEFSDERFAKRAVAASLAPRSRWEENGMYVAPEPVVEWLGCLQYSTGIRERVVAEMRQCEVAHAEGGKLAQCGERVPEVVCSTCPVKIEGNIRKMEGADPSRPRREATLPRRNALSTSRTVRASWNVCGNDIRTIDDVFEET